MLKFRAVFDYDYGALVITIARLNMAVPAVGGFPDDPFHGLTTDIAGLVANVGACFWWVFFIFV
jgi:hypothetical protein